MKHYLSSLMALFSACALAKGQTNDLSGDIIGAWKAGEFFISQPPPELWQEIKDITFYTNGLVEWSVVRDGIMVESKGRYLIQPDRESKRNLPRIFVAPTNYPDPRMSSIFLLLLREVEIDYDSRFPSELHGKSLKVTTDGQHLIFLKMNTSANKGVQAIGDKSPQPDP